MGKIVNINENDLKRIVKRVLKERQQLNEQLLTAALVIGGIWAGAEIGKGFIEIHHTKPIFKYLDEDIENTLEQAVKNLAPVCSNCHRMIHRNWSKPLEIQQLTNSVNQNGIFSRFN